MTEVFNLQELRDELRQGSAFWERLFDKDVLLALVEAVEAAQEMLTAYPGRDHLGRDARLRKALAPFNPKDSHE